jgi:hypothetical protein
VVADGMNKQRILALSPTLLPRGEGLVSPSPRGRGKQGEGRAVG